LHPPLLYYLMAPLFPLMGEDLRLIYVARGLMLLGLLLILREGYRIARTCFDPLTGLLAVLLLSYLLLWWRPAYEIRPDIPQTWLVLLGLRRFMQAWGERRPRDFLLAGALFGVAGWFLLKTLLPLVGLNLVFGLSVALRRSAAALRQSLTGLLWFASGFLGPVLLGAGLLWAAGAWPGFVQWVVIGAFEWPDRFSPLSLIRLRIHLPFFTLALVGVALTVVRLIQARIVDEVRLSPLLAGSVTAAIWLFLMPAPYLQTALPVLPLAAMYGAHVVASLLSRALSPVPRVPGDAMASGSQSARRLTWAGLAAILVFGTCMPPLLAVLLRMPPLRDHWSERRQLLRDVLALTTRDDHVFDATALSIFRPQATFHYRLIAPLRIWVQRGLLREDDIIDELWKSECKVALFYPYLIEAYPKLSRFLLSHYVPTEFHDRRRRLLVPGRLLYRGDLQSNEATISLVASTEYAVRTSGGAPSISINGEPYRAPVFLPQGDHRITVQGNFEWLVIHDSRAVAMPPLAAQ
ncbi:MAG: glycosyltransferase family 39 protein, partial [Candidatus Methylomirabilis sp.]